MSLAALTACDPTRLPANVKKIEFDAQSKAVPTAANSPR
jgi:hypothetical protein